MAHGVSPCHMVVTPGRRLASRQRGNVTPMLRVTRLHGPDVTRRVTRSQPVTRFHAPSPRPTSERRPSPRRLHSYTASRQRTAQTQERPDPPNGEPSPPPLPAVVTRLHDPRSPLGAPRIDVPPTDRAETQPPECQRACSPSGAFPPSPEPS